MPITKSSKIMPISAKTFRTETSDNIPSVPAPLAKGSAGNNEVHSGESGPINIPANK